MNVKRLRNSVSDQASASPSIDETRRNIGAQSEFASRSFADSAALSVTLNTSSGMLLPALVEASAPGRTARVAPVGILLYLASVGLIATATIGIFFGIGFFLLAQPTASIIADDAPAEQISATDSRSRYTLGKVSQPSGDAASVPIQPDILRSSATAPLPAAPLVQPALPASLIDHATASSAPEPSIVEVSLGSSPPEPSPPAPAPDALVVETPRGPSAAAPAAPVIEKPLGSSVAAARPAPAAPGLSAGQITELLTRGDTFVHAGDVASARLFYERAADAGDREAAMRMGATFDPAFLDRIGLHAPGDAAKALSWYRHALDLAAPKTDRQAQSSQTK